MPQTPPSPTLDELASIDKGLRRIDHEMRKLTERMQALHDKARRLRDRRRQLTPSAPWINRLPPDILAQIMLRGTQSIGNNVDLERDRILFPMAVSQVNHQWRQVALQLASLWTYITMDEGRPYNRTILWLKRSRNFPIDIDLDYRDQPKEAYYQRNFLITLNVLLPFIHRWGSVRILAPSSLLETALHVFSAPAPSLHTLILKGWSTPGDDTEEHWSPTIFCRNTPLLQNVYLHAIGLKWDSCMFTEMRDLTLSWIPRDTIFSLQELSRLIRVASPNLQRLAIVGSSPFDLPDWHVEHSLDAVLPLQVSLPRLQELRLESLDMLDIQTFIPLLHTPNLRKLLLSRIVRGPARRGMDLEAWRKSDWRPDLELLETLECNELEFDNTLFHAICKSTPNIRRLSIRGSSTNSILEFLTPEPLLMLPEEEILLPKLERLEAHDAQAEVMRAFVETRTSTLREVKGSILNDRKFKKATHGVDAIRQLGWEHNDAIHVAIRPGA